MLLLVRSAGGAKLVPIRHVDDSATFSSTVSLASSQHSHSHHIAKRPPHPVFTSFILASKLGFIDLKLYGVALIIHVPLKSGLHLGQLDCSVDLYAPVALVLMSRLPVSIETVPVP